MSYGRSTSFSSVSEVFSLNPLPYQVLLILAVIFIFLGLQWYVSLESAVGAEESMGWLLMVVSLVFLFAVVKWLSSFDSGVVFVAVVSVGRRRWERIISGRRVGVGRRGEWRPILLLLVMVRCTDLFFLRVVYMMKEKWMIFFVKGQSGGQSDGAIGALRRKTLISPSLVVKSSPWISHC
ncbi:hypothetical protein DH2020_004176 [Rehmannia glutinosa]|uniref:Transmembrane protein n=1 Tax=Rehmannia glutinosa TaxID=99300 RepID=A0ABR0XNR0_REHGL